MIYRLSIYLIKYIVSFLDLNSDRISFSLCCKGLFINRSNYLTFNGTYLPSENDFNLHELRNHLTSYNDLILQTIKVTPLTLLVINSKDSRLHYSYRYSHIVKTDSLDKSHIPPNTTGLAFGTHYGRHITFSSLPIPPITTISLSSSFNSPLFPGFIPESITNLSLGGYFSQLIPPGWLPSSLIKLELSLEFDVQLQVGSIPNRVRHLILHKYNHPFSHGILPDSLRHLELRNKYNHPLEVGDLPPRLQTLLLGPNFNSTIYKGSLPSSLIRLELTCSISQPDLTDLLPPSCREVVYRNNGMMRGLPQFVTHVTLGLYTKTKDIKKLPSSVTHLVLSDTFNDLLYTVDRSGVSTFQSILPVSLESLTLGNKYNTQIPINALPNTLKYLHFGDSFNSHVVLPPNLKHVSFGNQFRAGCDQSHPMIEFPKSLKSIGFPTGSRFDFKRIPTHIHHIQVFMLNRIYKVKRISDNLFLALDESLYAGGFMTLSLLSKLSTLY